MRVFQDWVFLWTVHLALVSYAERRGHRLPAAIDRRRPRAVRAMLAGLDESDWPAEWLELRSRLRLDLIVVIADAIELWEGRVRTLSQQEQTRFQEALLQSAVELVLCKAGVWYETGDRSEANTKGWFGKLADNYVHYRGNRWVGAGLQRSLRSLVDRIACKLFDPPRPQRPPRSHLPQGPIEQSSRRCLKGCAIRATERLANPTANAAQRERASLDLQAILAEFRRRVSVGSTSTDNHRRADLLVMVEIVVAASDCAPQAPLPPDLSGAIDTLLMVLGTTAMPVPLRRTAAQALGRVGARISVNRGREAPKWELFCDRYHDKIIAALEEGIQCPLAWVRKECSASLQILSTMR